MEQAVTPLDMFQHTELPPASQQLERAGTALRIVVYGSPAPQGSKRFVGMSGGRGRMIESSRRVKPWREDVKAAAELVRNGAAPLDEAVWVRMVFTVPKPKSAPRKRRTYPDRKPDVSKLARSTEDALIDAGVLRDDARIVGYTRLAKVFPGEDPEALEAPGVVITILTAEAAHAGSQAITQ